MGFSASKGMCLMIANPERQAFIRAKFVDQPLDKEGVRHWWTVYEAQRAKVERGEPATLTVRDIRFVERRRAAGELSVDQLAATIRHTYTMNLWDAEHREPPMEGGR